MSLGAGRRVVFTHRGIAAAAREMLEAAGFEVEIVAAPKPRERLLEALSRKPTHAMILRGSPAIDDAVFAAAPDLEMLSGNGVGYDTVDVAGATRRGILLTITGDANAQSVAEHALAMILAVARELTPLDALVRAGGWIPGDFRQRDAADHVLGLVGFGRIGARTAALARAVGLRVLAWSRTPARIDPALAAPMPSLDALLGEADIVSLHLPLTEASRKLVDRAFIAAMKPGAKLVNTARGALVDEAALAAALRGGRIAAAAVDTLSVEPADPAGPLLTAPNLLITPHVAALTEGAMERMGRAAADNVLRFFAGEPIAPDRMVNPEVLAARR